MMSTMMSPDLDECSSENYIYGDETVSEYLKKEAL